MKSGHGQNETRGNGKQVQAVEKQNPLARAPRTVHVPVRHGQQQKGSERKSERVKARGAAKRRRKAARRNLFPAVFHAVNVIQNGVRNGKKRNREQHVKRAYRGYENGGNEQKRLFLIHRVFYAQNHERQIHRARAQVGMAHVGKQHVAAQHIRNRKGNREHEIHFVRTEIDIHENGGEQKLDRNEHRIGKQKVVARQNIQQKIYGVEHHVIRKRRHVVRAQTYGVIVAARAAENSVAEHVLQKRGVLGYGVVGEREIFAAYSIRQKRNRERKKRNAKERSETYERGAFAARAVVRNLHNFTARCALPQPRRTRRRFRIFRFFRIERFATKPRLFRFPARDKRDEP